MKTKFQITSDVFSCGTLDECFSYYDKTYKEHGFILDKEDQEVYIIIDKEINLKEGDRVNLRGFRMVEWKCVDILNDMIVYDLKEE